MAQYYSDEDVLELTSDRCPASHQNYDYLNYVLTVLTLESKVCVYLFIPNVWIHNSLYSIILTIFSIILIGSSVDQ